MAQEAERHTKKEGGKRGAETKKQKTVLPAETRLSYNNGNKVCDGRSPSPRKTFSKGLGYTHFFLVVASECREGPLQDQDSTLSSSARSQKQASARQ